MNRYEIMLNELDSAKLEVQLVPVSRHARCYTGEHSCKRVAVSIPVRWYRLLCRRHPSSRGVRRGRFDTKIKRINILRLLARLAAGKPTWSKYAPELRAMAEGRK